MNEQAFIDTTRTPWAAPEFLPGVELLSLAEPVAGGSIHLARIAAGTTIPPHTHPADEFVYVLTGVVSTGSTRCRKGMFWHTPAGLRQGPHVAETDATILTIRLGEMGPFERSPSTASIPHAGGAKNSNAMPSGSRKLSPEP
jgi:uncharacterized cupin superfamily protein